MTDPDPGQAAAPDLPPESRDSHPPPVGPERESVPCEEDFPSSKEFLPLDPRVVGLWRLDQVLGWGFVLLLLLGGVGMVSWVQPELLPWAVLAWLLCAGLTVGFVLWYPARAYRAWGYRIDERVLEIRSGLVFRTLRLLPLSRIQHVDLQRGPLERVFGLASLVLFTAGTRDAAIPLPGLSAERAIRLRDHLLAIGGDDAV